MNLSILQLNINADNFWDQLITYLKNHNFDILNFQEVAGIGATSGNINSKRDCYQELQEILGNKYNSQFAITQTYSSNPSSGYIANATFYKKEFELIEKKIITMYERTSPFPSDKNSFEDAGRNLLHLTLQKDHTTFSVLNTHFAWAPTPKEVSHQTEQGEILIEYLKKVQRPFVLTGDFNLDPEQPIIKEINNLARNLISENNITNTLNPRTHEVAGKNLEIAVDYIFTSPDITVNNFTVLEDDLSDHMALTAKIEI